MNCMCRLALQPPDSDLALELQKSPQNHLYTETRQQAQCSSLPTSGNIHLLLPAALKDQAILPGDEVEG